MKKQAILSAFEEKLITSNYSKQTTQSYLSALSLFLQYIASQKANNVSEQVIEDYLLYCKTNRDYFLFINETGNSHNPLSVSKSFATT
jgi:site-specific recombinase XerD